MNLLRAGSSLPSTAAFVAGLLAVGCGRPARAGGNDAFSTNPAISAGVANFSGNFALGTTAPSASGGQTPASGDALYFGASTSANLNNDLSGDTFAGLTFYPGAPAFTVNGNAFTLSAGIANSGSSLQTFNNAISLAAGYNGTINATPGGITLNGGLSGPDVRDIYFNGAGGVTLGGINTLNFEGANTSNLVVGAQANAGNATGNLTISGTTTVNDTGAGGSYFGVDSLATLTIAPGATLNVSGGGNGFYIGLFNGYSFTPGGGVATVNVGGALNIGVNDPLQIAVFSGNGSTQATLNIKAGGIVTLASPANLGTYGTTAAAINLDSGGMLASNSSISGPGGAGNVTNFNFNGGTLKALAPQANWLNGLSAVTTSSNNSTIDANNQAVSISAAIADGATPGGLTITDSSASGGGVVTLSGANTYSGTTIVNGGTLRVLGPPEFPNGLQVMPLGDSITYGYSGSNAGYRGPLYNTLKSAAPNFLFVGSSTLNANISSDPNYALPQGEWHNEGHSSYRVTDINNNLDGYDPTIYNSPLSSASSNPNGGHWFDGISNPSDPNYRLPCYPDVILLMIGINDAQTALSTEQTNLNALLTKITTERPNAKLIVAQIIPSTASGTPAGWVNGYNAIVASLVASFQAAGKHISMVDLNTGFPAGGLISDGVHPNDLGFVFMAQQWYNALVAVCQQGYGPAQAIPASSAVVLGPGGTLDLGGSQAASAGPLSGSGKVTLGSGILTASNASGQDSTFSGSISGTGGLTKAGAGTLTLAGVSNYTGPTEVSAGVLKITGALTGAGAIDVASGATLNLAGGSVTASTVTVESGGFLTGNGTINGTVVNNGTIRGNSAGQTISFTGNLTNAGTIVVTSGAGFQVGGTLTNSGTVDLLTSSSILPSTVIEQGGGTAFDSRSLKVSAVTLANGSASVSLPSYTGHTFQLQRSASLSLASWQNVGNPQVGATGTALTFPDASPAANQEFYRVLATP
jgi:autotransporter-associated beta strand protein